MKMVGEGVKTDFSDNYCEEIIALDELSTKEKAWEVRKGQTNLFPNWSFPRLYF